MADGDRVWYKFWRDKITDANSSPSFWRTNGGASQPHCFVGETAFPRTADLVPSDRLATAWIAISRAAAIHTGFLPPALLLALCNHHHYHHRSFCFFGTNKTRMTMFATARRVLAKPATGAINRVALNGCARQRYLSALAILEQREGQLINGSLGAVTAAKKLGGSVHGFLAGASVKSAAEQAAKIDGIEKIITVDNAAYEKVSLTAENPMPILVHSLFLSFGRN